MRYSTACGLLSKTRGYIDYYFKGKRIREAIDSDRWAAESALATRKTEIPQGHYLEDYGDKKVQDRYYLDTLKKASKEEMYLSS